MLKKKEVEKIVEELGSQFPQAIAQQLGYASGSFGANSRVACLNGVWDCDQEKMQEWQEELELQVKSVGTDAPLIAFPNVWTGFHIAMHMLYMVE